MYSKLLLVLLFAFLATSAFAKRHHRHHKTTPTTTTTTEPQQQQGEDELDILQDDDENELTENEPAATPEAPRKAHLVKESRPHPCSKFHCGTGMECDINEQGKPSCVCIKHCPVETDDRRKVCSNHNDTWDSDCDVYRMRCLCKHEDAGCTNEKFSHLHVDYYGACRDIPTCTPDQMLDFPRRMREWLFNVMKDMADRNELSPDYLALEREAEESIQKKWVNAVIWKFCDLDSHPHDRAVSRHELFPIRAPLMTMEHCIAPFLDSCDENDDHLVTLQEWGKCLGIEEADISDKCPK